ncbi:Ser-Thr-rich GPI-anchored membrane family protein [Okeania sp.]|uniref:Ser-Thr-rich GPI-anchored membrane family protein n=1 Tax=Okeania sp. TaxID=3100323 RepID=UPI002B4B3BA3|nr:Ser-Thr-rich GPI-anchored membrane family protein [Okeania sp.]MEB3339278.1 Ser-Thr-rich GPI-anchored membrane family protein [Okeania sp.]
MDNIFEPESGKFGLEFGDPMLAGINETNNELRFASGTESSVASSELKIENIDTGNDDLLLPQNTPGKVGLTKSEESQKKTSTDKEDSLTGKGNDVAEQVDTLTGETSNEIEIQTRSAKKDKAGNSRKKAYNFGVLNDDEKLKEYVGRSDKKDYYKFKVKEKTDVDIDLRGLSGNADLYLENNKGKVLEKSTKSGKKAENIERTLNPGTYYVRVQPKGNANANYTLSLDGKLPDIAGNSLKKAHNLGVLKDDEQLQEFVSKLDKKDYYKFKVKEKTDVDIDLSGLSGNADLYLENNKGKVLEKSTKSGKKAENIERTLNPGTYYVRVQPKGNANANYTLSFGVESPDENLPYLLSTPLLDPEVQKNDNSSFAFTTPVDLPSSFDLREEGAVTPVRDQGSYGSCWAFASYASLESSILKASGTEVDLSENHLKNHNGFEWRIPVGGTQEQPGEGGNHSMSIAYLSRGDGPVNEADDPYKEYKDYPGQEGTPKYYVDNMLIFDTDTEMKQGLIDYGALYTTMAIDYSSFSKDKTTYYFSGGEPDGYHAVAIVGWDDNKAIPGASEEGAWLCKNSWGADWADDGYFWISYQDVAGANIGISFNDATAASNFNNIYYHDEFGQVSTFNSPYALNAFTAKENEALSAIGFYTQADSAIYNIKVYDDFDNGKPSQLLAETRGNAAYAGYHTVDLNSLVNLTAGEDFYIYLQIENGGNYPQAIDQKSYNSPDSTAKKGESYYSNDGKTWTDLTTWDSTANFSIKALTTETVKSEDFITVNSPNGGDTLEPGKSYNITWNDNISEDVLIYLYENNEDDSIITYSTPSDGSYDWKVPTNLASGSTYKIAIQSSVNGEIYDYSDDFFTIKASDFITVNSPNGGNTLKSGESYNITWSDNISEDIRIYLYENNEYDRMITDSTASDGSYNWKVPTNLDSGSTYQIAIQSVVNGEIYDYSDNAFTIQANDFITVNSPNGGNTLEPGKSYNITWSDNISEDVLIYLYENNEYDSIITYSTSSNGSYNWKVPTNLASGSTYKIAIQSAVNGDIYDFSDNFFTIKPDDLNSNRYYFTYSYNVDDSYNGYFYEKPGTYSLGDVLDSGSGVYEIWDVESGVGNKNDIGDVYVYSYNDTNYTGGNYEPFFWTWGLPAGINGLGSEYDQILGFFGYDYFDPYDEADG